MSFRTIENSRLIDGGKLDNLPDNTEDIPTNYIAGTNVTINKSGRNITISSAGEPGAPGENGENGKQLEIRVEGDFLQSRYTGDIEWTNIYDISQLDGVDGKTPEFRVEELQLQYKFIGDVDWITIYTFTSDTAVSWNDIQGKPTEFNPTAHGHAIGEISGLGFALNGKEPTFTKNTAFNKNFGTTTGTVTQGDDSRLTNAREWTATTIAQAEAETGTATTRRAFTAQRVRQSVIAWWNTITLAISDITGLQTELNAKANSDAVVDLTTAQTKAGVLTFTDSPIVPTPTTDTQVANKAYVDDNAGGGGGGFNPLYPHDLSQGFEIFREEVSNSVTYTVPTGKVLYITVMDGGDGRFTILGGQRVNPSFRYTNGSGYNNIAIPIIVDEGVVVSSDVNFHLLSGFLCNKNVNIEPIYGSSYTVPTGKILVITSIFKDNSGTAGVGSDTIIATGTRFMGTGTDISMDTIHQPIFVEAGGSFFAQGFSGYLIPDTFNI